MEMPKVITLLLTALSAFTTTDAASKILRTDHSRLFPAMFVFGDGTADVGTNIYLPYSPYKYDYPPYGRDFKLASGRGSNGKLLVDYLSEAIGIRTPAPYLQQNVSYSHGANFASSKSGVLDSTNCDSNKYCISLSKQVEQFSSIQSRYSSKFLAESLFYVSTGAHDYFMYNGTVNPTLYAQEVVNELIKNILSLYSLGARKMILFTIPSIGCLPAVLAAAGVAEEYPSCVARINQLAVIHNDFYTRAVESVKDSLTGSHIVTSDAFSFLSDLITNAEDYGFEQKFEACCGGGLFNANATCGKPEGELCDSPKSHIFWDSEIPTQGVFELYSKYIFSGKKYITPYGLEILAAQ